MKKIKKWHIIVMLVILIAVVIPQVHYHFIASRTTYEETLEDFRNVARGKAIVYYDSVEEAISMSQMEYIDSVKEIEIIESVDYKAEVLVFGKGKIKGTDALAVLLLEKNEDGQYSNAVMTTSALWKNKTWMVDKQRERNLDEEELFKITVLEDFLGNHCKLFYIESEDKNPRWGIFNSENIKTLKIDGRVPDGIIPVEMDGEQAYLWYYRDFKEPHDSLTTNLVTY